MNNEERQALLIDYAEGTLPKDRISELEALLGRSSEARNELELIRAAFQQLNEIPSGAVPDHYFTNFLPRLREKLERGGRRRFWSIPQLVEWMVRPVMVFAGVVIFASAYRSFEPQTTPSPIYNVVSEFAQDEIVAVLNEPLLVHFGTDESLGEISLGSEAFGADVSQYQTESDLSASLEEQELEQVVQQLEKRVIH